ncbi:MAG: hypothetical protein QMD80_01365 [archaeon]|nr:hypothetical protein [archaeon]
MKEFGAEKRGEIAVIFDAGIIMGLCYRENREEEIREERLYKITEELLSAIGREIGRRVYEQFSKTLIFRYTA